MKGNIKRPPVAAAYVAYYLLRYDRTVLHFVMY